MAEAAVDHPIHRFFCHKCTQEINPVLPDFVCPRCRSGFIEELAQSFETSSADDTTVYTDEGGEPLNVEQLLGHVLSDMDYIGQERPRGTSMQLRSRTNSSRAAENDQSQQQSNPRQLYDRIRSQVNNSLGAHYESLSMEEIIQQIISNLSGAAGASPNTGIPILFNLHGNPGDYAWGRTGLDSIISQLLNQLDDGNGPPPLSQDVISQIPTVAISEEQVAKALQCTVCMEDFKKDESVRKLPCTHHFHHNCIVPWLELHGTCPICRKVFGNEESEMENEIDLSISGRASSSSSYSSTSDTTQSSSNSSTGESASSATSSSSASTSSSRNSQPTEYNRPSTVYDFSEEVD